MADLIDPKKLPFGELLRLLDVAINTDNEGVKQQLSDLLVMAKLLGEVQGTGLLTNINALREEHRQTIQELGAHVRKLQIELDHVRNREQKDIWGRTMRRTGWAGTGSD